MNKNFLTGCWMVLLGSGVVPPGLAAELSEQDYFSELPTVLTVSRLAQPLHETPGAVTVIDRETIQRSGARELTDLLRLVPGYIIGGYNGANLTASYHALLDDFGIRNLVMIDGRSVYSAYFLGDTTHGMMGVLLEDIERIEVLRGSNSAAYGANAMFGVINIITRNAEDTHGAVVSVTQGGGGVKDNYARIGWGGTGGSYRLSTGRRSDSGYANAHDDKIFSQLNFRGDLRPSPDQEVMISAGFAELAADGGFARQSAGNPERTIDWRNVFLLGQWKRQLTESEEIKLTANFNEETLGDAFTYLPDPSVVFSQSGVGRRFNLEFQHQRAYSPQLRAVWGAGYKYEDAKSRWLYNTSAPVAIHEERLFGNLEWRPHSRWLINAGGFAGHHSRTGNYFSPRLMANFLATQDHALRIGATRSSRSPTLFELESDVRYAPKNALHNPLQIPLPARAGFADYFPYFAAMGQEARAYASSGSVSAERLRSQELGYFGNFRALRLTLDVRAFWEQMKDVIVVDRNRIIPGYLSGVIPAGTSTNLGPLPFAYPVNIPLAVSDFVNGAGLETHGLEYQLRWKPFDSSELWLNQTFQHTHWDDGSSNKPYAPTHATTVAWFEKLPLEFDLGVIFQAIGDLSWNKQKDALPRTHRLDLRLAKPFRVGSTRVEAALVVQAANGDQPVYQTGTRFSFERRAFGTLRIAF